MRKARAGMAAQGGRRLLPPVAQRFGVVWPLPREDAYPAQGAPRWDTGGRAERALEHDAAEVGNRVPVRRLPMFRVGTFRFWRRV